MSEKYDFSEDKNGDIFRQLPQEEKEAVIGAAQEEMAEIHKKARALADAGEKPTALHYSTAAEAMADEQEVAEQVDGEKQKEIILTLEQEEAKKAFIKKLSNAVSLDTYIDNALEIKKQNFLPERIVQQTAKESFIRCLLVGHIKSAIRIKNEFLLSEEIVSSSEVQQAIRYARTVNLSFGYKWDDENNDLHFKPDISKEYSTVEEVNNKIKGKEKLILELLQDISSLQKNGVLSDDKNFLQYSEIYKHRLSRDEKIVLSPLLEGIRYDDCDGGEKHQRVLLSIFNKERREGIVDNYYKSLIVGYQYENSSFIDQVRINKDDIIFLAARSAVPWGIMYKEFIENLKKLLIQEGDIDSAKKIPNPEFKLADVKLKHFGLKKEEWDIFRQRAIDRYIKKLEPIKQKVKEGVLKEPVKIAIFDESGDTGQTLRNQELAIQEAAKILGIRFVTRTMKYVTSNPKNPSPISDVADGIARRVPRGEEILKEIEEMKEYNLEDAFLMKAALDRLYEQESLKILKTAGRRAFDDDQKWILNRLLEGFGIDANILLGIDQKSIPYKSPSRREQIKSEARRGE